MATNHTPNYQLNQWEATDQVRRTDFNEDNAKIDAALEANAQAIAAETEARTQAVTALANRSRFTKLKESSVSANTRLFELDLSDIDWAAWDKVHIDIVSTNTDVVQLHYNTADNDRPNMVLGGIRGVHHRPRLTFFVGNDPQRWIFVRWGSSEDEIDTTYAELEKLIFDTGVLETGTTFTVLGER